MSVLSSFIIIWALQNISPGGQLWTEGNGGTSASKKIVSHFRPVFLQLAHFVNTKNKTKKETGKDEVSLKKKKDIKKKLFQVQTFLIC